MTPISDLKSRYRVNGYRLLLPQRVNGFTLLELLVVLSVILIASSVIIPNITGTDSNILIAQVRQTASAFNYARRLAIVEGKPQVATLFMVDPEDPEYSEMKGEILQRATIPLLENINVDITFQADINAEPEALEIIDLEFFPQGGSTGGILNFTLEEITASILVNPITGRISMRYPGEEFEE